MTSLKMTKLFSWINLLLLVLALSASTAEGEKPSYTDCQPHIDATIRDLAAKAVQAGEEPSDPEKLDYDSRTPEPIESEDETDTDTDDEEDLEGPHTEVDESDDEEETVKVESEEDDKENESDSEDNKEVESDEDDKSDEERNDISDDEQEDTDEEASKPTVKAQKSKKGKDKKTKKHKNKKDRSKSPHKHSKEQKNKQTDKRSRSTSPQDDARSKPVLKSKVSKDKIGIFDKFIDVIFGLPDQPRNPKYATPWNTHPEFNKKETKDKSETKKPTKVPAKSNAIFEMVNKAIRTIFNLPQTVKRDPKYAKPWQTHEEHKPKEKPDQKAQKMKVVEKKPFMVFRFINQAVELIFGKVTTQRDPKFAKPWQSHDEFKPKPKPEGKVQEKKQKKEPVKTSGGIINSMISLVFEVPSGKRDPKWAQPWNTHEEHKPKESKSSKEVKKPKKIDGSTNFIGNFINKFVYTIFGKPEKSRDKKWKDPWNTHAEHVKSTSSTKAKPKTPKKSVGESGIIGKMINKAVMTIFGTIPEKRDPKWATPWMQLKEAEDRQRKEARRKTSTEKTSVKDKTPSPPKESKKQPSPEHKRPEKSPTPSPPRSSSPSPPRKTPSPSPERELSPPPKREDTPPPPKSTKESRSETPKPKSKVPKKEDQPSKQDKHKEIPKSPPPKSSPKVVKKEESPIYMSIEDDYEPMFKVSSSSRTRDHINSILGLDEAGGFVSKKSDSLANEILGQVQNIHDNAIKPLEKTYKYRDITNRHLTESEIFGIPQVLLLGPYSTGKSSFINYILGTESTNRALKTGTPPSHGIFRIIQHGNHDRRLDGTDIGGQKTFSTLQTFGQNFIDQVKGVALDVPLLKKVTFIEAPGILEMRRPNERIYPFNDVLQWFIDRADLILIMFDYTKLDAGFEMEAILDQLKGREAQTRILLNKADQVPPEELMKVQGSLFWNLSPLLGVNAPPVVYAGSFASIPYRSSSPIKLFQAQEEALMHDIAKAIGSRVENRIAITRRHAVRVRNHARMVDTYLTTFRKNKGFLTSKHKLAEDIVENPHEYNIYEGASLQSNVSRYDLPDPEIYRDFFRVHNLYDFRTLKETCGFLGGCPMEKLDAAINSQLPQLITKYRRQLESFDSSAKGPSFKTEGGGPRSSHSHHSKS